MNALRCVLVNTAHQIAVNFLRHKRNHRCGALADIHKRRIKGHISVDLILLHALRPETLPASSHIPVAHFIHKVVQNARRLGDSVIVQMVVHFLDGSVQLGEQPLIHHRKFIVFQSILRRVKIVDIRIQHEERVGVPERAEELALPLLHRLAVETVGQPGCRIDIEIPADRIRAVSLKRLKRIHCVALGLAHLLPVLVLHMPQHDHVLEGRTVKQERGFRHQGVKPPARLIHRLGDKLRRKLAVKQLFIFKRIVVLRKGHRAGIKPAVDHLRHTLHGSAALGASAGNLVDIWSVQLHGLRRRIAAHFFQFLAGTDGIHMTTALALPHI